jgi:hypothetical protein
MIEMQIEEENLDQEIKATLWASSGLLIGWEAISHYVKKRPRTLRRYRQLMAFPVFRFGRHVMTDPALIRAWLLIVASDKRATRQGQESAAK